MVAYIDCWNLSEVVDVSFPFWVGVVIFVDSVSRWWFSIESKFSYSSN